MPEAIAGKCEFIGISSARTNNDILMYRGNGEGVEVMKSVVYTALQLMANDERLAKSYGNYRTLLSHGGLEPLDDHKIELRVLGFLCLLHCLLTGLGPEPISYSVLWVALMDERRDFDFDDAFLAEVDTANAAFFRCWQGWDGRKTSLTTEADGEFAALAAYIDAAGVQVGDSVDGNRYLPLTVRLDKSSPRYHGGRRLGKPKKDRAGAFSLW